MLDYGTRQDATLFGDCRSSSLKLLDANNTIVTGIAAMGIRDILSVVNAAGDILLNNGRIILLFEEVPLGSLLGLRLRCMLDDALKSWPIVTSNMRSQSTLGLWHDDNYIPGVTPTSTSSFTLTLSLGCIDFVHGLNPFGSCLKSTPTLTWTRHNFG
ncbi:hypothetical protein RIF29_27083 [Crotalaria pallida]|uniref:Uncharacterized protein n=1 Tax=Crotalaria pallida TaxID=3830 RepID=A0AAN9I215_CROPI